MIVVQHADGFSVVELLGSEGEISTGDVLHGDWETLGSDTFTKGRARHEGYFQGNWGDVHHAIRIAANTGGGLPR